MTEVALAAGFGSVRRFNEAIRAAFERPPRELRRGAARGARAAGRRCDPRLAYRPPLDWSRAARRSSRCARCRASRSVDGRALPARRSRSTSAGTARGAARPRARSSRSACCASPSVDGARPRSSRACGGSSTSTPTRSRSSATSRRSARSRRSCAARPGLRVPGAWDGFELAVRAILGQQVSVAAARTLAGPARRALRRRRSPAPSRAGAHAPVPDARARSRAADLAGLGHAARARRGDPRARRARSRRRRLFARPRARAGERSPRRALPGIGAWTAQYIAHARAAASRTRSRAGDLGLRRGAGADGRRAGTDARCSRRAEALAPVARLRRRISGRRSRGAVHRAVAWRAIEPMQGRDSADGRLDIDRIDNPIGPVLLALRDEPALRARARRRRSRACGRQLERRYPVCATRPRGGAPRGPARARRLFRRRSARARRAAASDPAAPPSSAASGTRCARSRRQDDVLRRARPRDRPAARPRARSAPLTAPIRSGSSCRATA